jgi:antitoxin (DNA-binding transcriptional repressor) of toxin-antitoxin stability system
MLTPLRLVEARRLNATGEWVERERRMIEGMAQVHMSEAEVVKDIQAVLEKVRQGAEVIVEQGDRTVAIIKPVQGPGRPIDECIALAKARESGPRWMTISPRIS